MSKKYSNEQINCLKRYYPDSEYDEIFKLFPGYTKREIRIVAHNHKIKNNNPTNRKDLIGMRSGKLVVTKMLPNYKFNKTFCECKCDCGGKKITQAYYISNKKVTNCGCERGKARIKDYRYEIGEVLKEQNSGIIKILDRKKIYVNGTLRKIYNYECEICKNKDSIQEYSLSRGHGCNVCANQKIKVGINDMWTTDPDLASLLEDPNEGYSNMRSTKRKTNWKCPICGNIVKNITINQMAKQRNVPCPKCSDGISYPNKFMYYILKSLNENFIREYTPDWISPKKYDFSLYKNGEKYIIEMDGGLGHGNRVFSNSIRTVEDGINIDNYKDNMAKKHGYIVIRINCDYGHEDRFEYIKTAIVNSELKNILDFKNINFNNIDSSSQKSVLKECCDIYNLGITKTQDIAKVVDIHRSTVTKYLNKGAKLGWCNYNPKKVKRNGNPICREVIQYDLNLNFINKFSSITLASTETNTNRTGIVFCCQGKNKTAGGYIWKYADDVENNTLEVV